MLIQVDQAGTELFEMQAIETKLRDDLAFVNTDLNKSSAQARQASSALQAAKAASKQHRQEVRKLASENAQLHAEVDSARKELQALRAHLTAVKVDVANRTAAAATTSVDQGSQTAKPGRLTVDVEQVGIDASLPSKRHGQAPGSYQVACAKRAPGQVPIPASAEQSEARSPRLSI